MVSHPTPFTDLTLTLRFASCTSAIPRALSRVTGAQAMTAASEGDSTGQIPQTPDPARPLMGSVLDLALGPASYISANVLGALDRADRPPAQIAVM